MTINSLFPMQYKGKTFFNKRFEQFATSEDTSLQLNLLASLPVEYYFSFEKIK
jgi:hypothetical protein